MAADGTIRSRLRSLLRTNSIKLKRRGHGRNCELSKVTLEKVLGITAAGNRALSCDSGTGLLAYPAGCVVVLLNPRKNKQLHIFNASRKAITTLAFSPDGKYVVTGESGHMPAVRVWDVSERAQIAELQEHKYGVACVTFSPNGKYIVSVGYQHDMMVHVWNWKKNVVVAANKVSSKVWAVSFSADSSYFVTAGNRHIKFWYLDHTKTNKVNATVPLLGRSGLLGELRTHCFTDVACGRGKQSSSTFCITSSGLLCEFNDRRLLDKWVELRSSQATCLSVSEELIFCGCSDGTVRAFSPHGLSFLCTLPRPHSLGVDISHMTRASQLFSSPSSSRFPDAVAVTFDPVNAWLSCVYNDHSVYVWDVQHVHERDLHVQERDPRRAGKLYSALYHSSCVWGLETYPDSAPDPKLPPGSFLSCSSDCTIRIWHLDQRNQTRNILSHDLMKIVYVEENLSLLLDAESSVAGGNSEKAGPEAEMRAGLRTLKVRPDGAHLASGDRLGVLRIHDLKNMEEILNVQAHDSEILCLEFSKPDTGLQFLASASRDRLIHVLDSGNDYGLVQTLDEHSSSITAVRFTANEGQVRLISCGADKSVYFRTAQQTEAGLEFTRTHHAVRKTTLYDMDIEPSRKYAAVGCQDRTVRIFNISNGKQKKMFKGSRGEDGTLIKVQIDPSGLYIATSCSDKNINIFDFYSGECVASMYGHSEIVTGLKFSSDCKHLLSASGDSCIFVWRLPAELTIRMKQRLAELRPQNSISQSAPGHSDLLSSRGAALSSDSEHEEEEEPCPATATADSKQKQKVLDQGTKQPEPHPLQPEPRPMQPEPRPLRRRWSRDSERGLMVQSMFDLRDLDSCETEVQLCPSEDNPTSHSRMNQSQPEAGLKRTNQELGSTVSLQVPDTRTNHRPDFIQLANQSPEREVPVLYPDQWEDRVSLAGHEFVVQVRSREDKPSPDSGVSLGFSSSRGSPERPTDSERLSADGNSSDLDEEEEEGPGSERGVVPQTPDQEAFLKEHFGNLGQISPKGSPSRTSHSSSESLSISSRFLSHCSAHSHPAVPLASRSDGKTPLISEVRPLRPDQDQNQDQGLSQDLKAGLEPGLDQTQTQEKPQTVVFQVQPLMDQTQDLNQGLNQDLDLSVEQPRPQGREGGAPVAPVAPVVSVQAQSEVPGLSQVSAPAEDTVETTAPPRVTLFKKKLPDHRRSQGPRVQGPNQSQGMRKSQSVSSLVQESADPAPSSSDPAPSAPVTPVRPSTLPWTSRRPLAASVRSYMSPTAASKAKGCRSVSIGDGLDHEPEPIVTAVTVPIPSPSVATMAVPVLVATTPSGSGRSLQSRVQNKPLPDKPLLSTFSANAPPEPHPLVYKTPPNTPMAPPTSQSHTHSSDRGPALGVAGTVKEAELSVEACEALTNELQSVFSRATHLYRKLSVSSAVGPTPEQRHMTSVLSECFRGLRAELEGLPLSIMGEEGGANVEGGRTAAILEEYSLLLVQAVTKRLQSPTHPST